MASGVDETRDFSEIVGLLYDTVLDPSLWKVAIRAVADRIGSPLSGFTVFDSQKMAMVDGIIDGPADAVREFTETYSAIMPRELYNIQGFQVGKIYSTGDLMNYDAFLESRFYHEFARRHGVSDSVVACVMNDGLRFANFSFLQRDRAHPQTLRNLELYLPHLQRAVAISDLLRRAAHRQALSLATIDALSIGVILVGADSAILHANDVANGLLRSGALVRSQGGRLLLSLPSGFRSPNDAEFVNAIKRISTIRGGGIALFDRSSRGVRAIMHILPLGQSAVGASLFSDAAAAIFIALDDQPIIFPEAALGELFGLTGAEQRLLGLLGEGKTLPEAAAAMDIAVTTARTHLSRLFQKTATSRQAGLVQLLHSLSPPVR